MDCNLGMKLTFIYGAKSLKLSVEYEEGTLFTVNTYAPEITSMNGNGIINSFGGNVWVNSSTIILLWAHEPVKRRIYFEMVAPFELMDFVVRDDCL